MSTLSQFKIFVNVSLILMLTGFLSAQAPIYDDCTKAYELCPNIPATVNNIGATKLMFPGSPDVFPGTFCFTANNTIWLKFYTNETGGFGQIVFSNLIFENNPGQDNQVQGTILEALAPCDATTYTPIGNCEIGTNSGFTLSGNFQAFKTYYVVLNGDMTGTGITKAAEFTADVFLTGPGVLRPTPNITIQADKDTICKDELITFFASLTQCPDSTFYNWYLNDVLIATTIDTFLVTSAVSKGDVVKVSNSCFQNCKVYPSATLSTIEVIQFQIDAGEDKEIEYGESVVLNGSTEVQNFYWSPIDNLVGMNTFTPIVNPTVNTIYYITGDSSGCVYTDNVFVKVNFDLSITNTFTPNEDGSNDTWQIPGLINYPNCLIQVYDRWGQLAHSSSGYNESKAWNGKRN